MLSTNKSIPSNRTELLNRIKEDFPNVIWTKYKYLDEGWDHEVIILDEKLVFRFPNDPEYLKLLKTEVKVLRKLRPLISSVNIPNYSYVAPDYSYAGYQYLKGQTLTKPYIDGLSANERNAIAMKLADFLTVMHTAIPEGHNLGKVPQSDMAETQADNKILSVKHLKTILRSEDYHLVESILENTDKILAEDLPSVLLHGDIYSTHLLWDDELGELGIIDFSDMNRGDPAFDVAELFEYGDGFVQRIYQYYAGPKDNTFLSRALAYQKWVGVFMMTDHFIHHKTSFEKARQTFDRTKNL
jgi:aminoglycoside phosphotransferase (APT) family kinase protein